MEARTKAWIVFLLFAWTYPFFLLIQAAVTLTKDSLDMIEIGIETRKRKEG